LDNKLRQKMGGQGSGRQKYGARWTVEECQRWRLSMKALTQAGYLSAVGQCMTVWLNYPSLVVEIDLGVNPRMFIRNTQQSIGLASVPRYFGGVLWFFVCPDCLRRCRDLYLSKRVYCCRICSNLGYDCSSEKHDMPWFYLQFAEARGVSLDEARREVREYMRSRQKSRKPRANCDCI
jgi:hypothetical protein